MNNKTRAPLFHVVKRGDVSWKTAWLVRGIALVAALIVCAIITTVLTGENPIGVYAAMLNGAFGSGMRIWWLFEDTAILLMIALAVTPAFRMRFWNIGAEGQVLAGGLATAVTMIYLGGVIPNWLLIILSGAAGIAAGALWALIPAFFKAKFGTNETLFTLMMNYIATQLIAWFTVWKYPKGTGTIGIINQSSRAGWLPTLFNDSLLIIIVAAVSTALVFVYMNYSKHGYELSVVGESERTARYVGIKVEKVIIRTLLLSGAICGVVGFLLVSGVDHSVTVTTAGGRGFTAVMVSWLAQFNPIIMIFASLLICFLDRGTGQVVSQFPGLDKSLGDILTGVVLFFLIGAEFFINYRIVFAKKERKEEKANA